MGRNNARKNNAELAGGSYRREILSTYLGIN